jgi:hypothetical protein
MLYQKEEKSRSVKHLKHVKKHMCCITRDGENCNQGPIDPHHLMKIGGRGISLKESDEWTVPLCRMHHHQVSISGDETNWWERWGKSYDEVIEIAVQMALTSPDKDIVQAMEINLEKGDFFEIDISARKITAIPDWV